MSTLGIWRIRPSAKLKSYNLMLLQPSRTAIANTFFGNWPWGAGASISALSDGALTALPQMALNASQQNTTTQNPAANALMGISTTQQFSITDQPKIITAMAAAVLQQTDSTSNITISQPLASQISAQTAESNQFLSASPINSALSSASLLSPSIDVSEVMLSALSATESLSQSLSSSSRLQNSMYAITSSKAQVNVMASSNSSFAVNTSIQLNWTYITLLVGDSKYVVERFIGRNFSMQRQSGREFAITDNKKWTVGS